MPLPRASPAVRLRQGRPVSVEPASGTSSGLPTGTRLVWADSELLAVDITPDGLCLRLSAAHVRWTDRTLGLQPVSAYLPGLAVHLEGVAPPVDGAGLSGRIVSGWLARGNERHATLPLEVALPGPLALELQLAHGRAIRWSARKLRLTGIDPGALRPSLAC